MHSVGITDRLGQFKTRWWGLTILATAGLASFAAPQISTDTPTQRVVFTRQPNSLPSASQQMTKGFLAAAIACLDKLKELPDPSARALSNELSCYRIEDGFGFYVGSGLNTPLRVEVSKKLALDTAQQETITSVVTTIRANPKQYGFSAPYTKNASIRVKADIVQSEQGPALTGGGTAIFPIPDDPEQVNTSDQNPRHVDALAMPAVIQDMIGRAPDLRELISSPKYKFIPAPSQG